VWAGGWCLRCGRGGGGGGGGGGGYQAAGLGMIPQSGLSMEMLSGFDVLPITPQPGVNAFGVDEGLTWFEVPGMCVT